MHRRAKQIFQTPFISISLAIRTLILLGVFISPMSVNVCLGESLDDSTALISQYYNRRQRVINKYIAPLEPEYFFCRNYMSTPEKSLELAAEFTEGIEPIETLLRQIDSDIAKYRDTPEQRVLGLVDKLLLQKYSIESTLCSLKTRQAVALKRSKDPEKTAAANKTLLAMATKMAAIIDSIPENLVDENKAFILGRKYQAAMALYELDAAKAMTLLQKIVEDENIAMAEQAEASAALCRSAAQSGDYSLAMTYLDKFVQTTKQHPQYTDENNALSQLQIALLNENICYHRAAYKSTTTEQAQQCRAMAAETLEGLFRERPTYRVSIAERLINYFAYHNQPDRIYPATIYARILMQIHDDQLPEAFKTFAGNTGQRVKLSDSSYLENRALLILADAALQKTKQPGTTDIKAWFSISGEYFYRFAQRVPDDPRFPLAMNNAIVLAQNLYRYKSTEANFEILAERVKFFIASSRASKTDKINFAWQLAHTYVLRDRPAEALELLPEQTDGQIEKYGPVALRLEILATQSFANNQRDKGKQYVDKILTLAKSLENKIASETNAELKLTQQETLHEIKLKAANLLANQLDSYEKSLEICDRVIAQRSKKTSAQTRINAQLIRLNCLLSLNRLTDAAEAFQTDAKSLLLTREQSFQSAMIISSSLSRQINIDIARAAKAEDIAKMAAAMKIPTEFMQRGQFSKLRTQDAQTAARCDALFAQSVCESAGESAVPASIAASEENQFDMKLIQARLLWERGKWPKAVEKYHQLAAAIAPSGSEAPSENWWITQALLARCVLENAANNPAEKKRLRVRLRQLQLKYPDYGGFGYIFVPMIEYLAAN